jgi:hypothetical protein
MRHSRAAYCPALSFAWPHISTATPCLCDLLRGGTGLAAEEDGSWLAPYAVPPCIMQGPSRQGKRGAATTTWKLREQTPQNALLSNFVDTWHFLMQVIVLELRPGAYHMRRPRRLFS